MAGIIEFPQVVQEALRDFGDLFANEPQRRHFAEYLTGLYVAARKTVTGINAEFARTTDPSCLNRFVHLSGSLGCPGPQPAASGPIAAGPRHPFQRPRHH